MNMSVHIILFYTFFLQQIAFCIKQRSKSDESINIKLTTLWISPAVRYNGGDGGALMVWSGAGRINGKEFPKFDYGNDEAVIRPHSKIQLQLTQSHLNPDVK